MKLSSGSAEANYTWDLRNRLVGVDTNNTAGDEISIEYDFAGNRITRTDASGTIRFVVDDSNPTGYSQTLEEWNGGSDPQKAYVIGADVIGQFTGSAGIYLGYDARLSTRFLTNTSGAITARYDYDAYGVDLDNGGFTNTVETGLKYAGEQYDSDFVGYFNRARYYQPNLGRLSGRGAYEGQADTPSTMHPYVYAKGPGSREAGLAMVFKLAQQAEKGWRRLNGHELLKDVVIGIQFVDGEKKAA